VANFYPPSQATQHMSFEYRKWLSSPFVVFLELLAGVMPFPVVCWVCFPLLVAGDELKACVQQLQRRYLKRKLQELSKEVAQAESKSDTKKVEALTSEFSRLTNQLRENEKRFN